MTAHAWQHANAPRRGSAILLALFFLTALFLLAQAFQKLLPVELNAALIHQTDTSAYFAADAGVQDASAFIGNELSSGREPLSASPSTRTGSIGGWTWSAVIIADGQTPPNGTNSLRTYQVVSTASFGGRPMRRITTWLSQQSFARFALYCETVPDGACWDPAAEHYDGPLHLNGPLNIWTYSSLYNGGYPPLFYSSVSSASTVSGSADGVGYNARTGGYNPPYDSRGNPIKGRYEAIYAQGRPSLQTGVARIEMPTSTSALANAAWGDPTMPKPTTTGVYVNQAKTGNDAAGGIYIVGGVSKMEMSVDGGGNRVLTITQANGKTVVTETLSSAMTAPGGQNVPQGRTVVTPPSGKSQVLNTLTNGVVYSTNTIASLKGTNKGARTIATELTQNAEIVVGGSILRADTLAGQTPTGTADNLGLVCHTLRFPTSLPRNAATPVYLYAAAMAGSKEKGGGTTIDGYGSGGLGYLNIYGGIISYVDGCTSGPAGTTGFIRTIHYDSNLAKTPPPYFPSYTKFTVKSWLEESLRK